MFLYCFWIIATLGITHIITGTKIFEKIRFFLDVVSPNFFGVLFGCPTCMGFWVGLIVSIFFPMIKISEVNFDFVSNTTIQYAILWFMHGAFCSACNWLTNMVTTYVDAVTTNIELKNELIVNNPLEIAKQILSEES